MFEKCYCGSDLLYSKCCKPYIKGKAFPPTPEALMRSRYTAYVIHDIDYIIDTCQDGKSQIDRERTTDWSENSKWLGLEIIFSNANEESSAGVVEFKAAYECKRLKYVPHEHAKFLKRDGRWYYWEGTLISYPIVRNGEKIGRNHPCPCRSGKKYKQCCGR